jgi:hypothetical protein
MPRRWKGFKAVSASFWIALAVLCPGPADAAETARACGRRVALVFSPQSGFDAEGPGSLDAIRGRSAPGFVRELDAVCRASPARRSRYARVVRRIRIAHAQGATEPTPFLDGRTLVIEFFGGPYDRALLRRYLRSALDGRPIHND